MRRWLRSCGLALALLPGGLAGSAAQAEALTVQLLADGFAPLQYRDAEGRVAGYVKAYVDELLRHAAQRLPLEVQPLQWVPLKRALLLAQDHGEVLVLSLARTPEREAGFYWLAEVAPYQLRLYRARQHAPLGLKSLADLKGRGLRIGLQDRSNFHELLIALGIGQAGDNTVLDLVPANWRNLGKAALGRIDLFAHPEISLAHRAQEQGLKAEDFVTELVISELSHPLWLALSRRSDPRLAVALQRSHAALQAQGRLEALRRAELAHPQP